MNLKNIVGKEKEYEIKMSECARTDRAWLDYIHLAPADRIPRRQAELWSQKELAKVELKKFLK